MGRKRLTDEEKNARKLKLKLEELAGIDAVIKERCGVLVELTALSEIIAEKQRLEELQGQRMWIVRAIDKCRQLELKFTTSASKENNENR